MAEGSGVTLWDKRKTMEELPEQKMFVNDVAAAISRHGLQTPALIFLEAGHPLTFLGAQLLWVAQPALSLLMPAKSVAQLAHLLEEPEAVRVLTMKLEAGKVK